ncbi:LOW QUALITY PROTEIN: transcription factor BTF3 homolog 4-like [Peromyscus leucopus]|uniref:LOW QUALITY PROTEIN: transcription factor BTF3 homolog 4-like n=1 Tax=Peromyscus leucopus TaxID=10041 RepID=UPI0018849AEF|nr:LOW QUALITY PROTEIN: transcription factor BTF3 homolog 4-like [Peromyscus leucopus]
MEDRKESEHHLLESQPGAPIGDPSGEYFSVWVADTKHRNRLGESADKAIGGWKSECKASSAKSLGTSLLWINQKHESRKVRRFQAQVQIGGKSIALKTEKVVLRTFTAEDKRLQSYQKKKKLVVNNTASIEEINMIKDNDGRIIHLNNPKVHTSLSTNNFAITVHTEDIPVIEMLPGILSQLAADRRSLRKLAEHFPWQVWNRKSPKPEDIDEDASDIPDLVENAYETLKNETKFF